ncbi:MAG: hypothetical protein ACI4F5_03370 [Acutalibacteraceae bacterium]
MKFKNHISSQVERAKKELSLFEYILWWIMRSMMIVALICTMRTRSTMTWVMVCANLAVMFIIPLFSFIFPNKTFFGRIPFRVQTYIDLFVIAGSFFGHFVDLYRFEGIFDKALHVVSGFVTVFIGYELMKVVEPKNPLTKKTGVFGGFMFSYFVMIMWEVFEFFSDFILNSNNQAYTKRFCEAVYTDDYFFFKIFGRGNAGAEQLPVFDTMIDILAAVVGSFIALAVMMIFIKEKKTENTEIAYEEEKEEITV